MAKVFNGDTWKFTAAADAEGIANKDESTVPNFANTPIFIRGGRLDTGDGGDFVLNISNAGKEIIKMDSTPANDSIPFVLNAYFRGVYVQTLQTNASITLYVGVPTDG